MNVLRRHELDRLPLPGRIIQKAIGKDAESLSGRMTVGVAHYSAQSGAMTPHHHAEECVIVLESLDGYVRYGPQKDQLGERVRLEAGTVLHVPAWEWHVFEFDEGGHVDIAFFYAQVDNIRPEERE
jgi:hypothetical protein